MTSLQNNKLLLKIKKLNTGHTHNTSGHNQFFLFFFQKTVSSSIKL